MMPQPLVSVVIPAYRCAETISLSINTALAQDVPLEVLVIDDCPDSPIDQFMEQYQDDDRVIYLRNPKILGAAETRNRGIQMAKAPYVAFLDADDIWRPGKLKKQLDALERTGYVLCCTARELMTVQGVFTGKVIPVKEDISYKGRAYRDNSKVADWALAASRFAGYYTMALAPMDDFAFELGEPCGNG